MNSCHTSINGALYIPIILLFQLSVEGSIKWTLRENPAVFGTNIHLVCHLPKDTCCNDYRKWNVGNQYILVILNGLSYNLSKYKEDLIKKDQVSVLTIFSFSEEDINIPYECVYGFHTDRSVLKLEDDVFEYHPTEALPVIPTIKGHNISFSIHFKKVFPIPLCQAKFGVFNLSTFLSVTVTRKKLFYESSISFTYFTTDSVCKESLTVLCTVGKTVLAVVDYKACPLSEVAAQDIILPSIIISSIVLIATIIIVITVIYRIRRAQQNVSRHSQDNDHEVEEMLKIF